MILTQNVSKQTQSLTVILSSSSDPLKPPQQSLGSEACVLTSQLREGSSRGSAAWGELVSQGGRAAEDDQQMAHT